MEGFKRPQMAEVDVDVEDGCAVSVRPFSLHS